MNKIIYFLVIVFLFSSVVMAKGKVAREEKDRVVGIDVKDFTEFIEDETINYAIDSTNEEITKAVKIGQFRTENVVLTGNEEIPIYESINAMLKYPVLVMEE